jgi:hypothetical protein
LRNFWRRKKMARKCQLELKKFKVTYRSRYYPYEGERTIIVKAHAKQDVRNAWPDIILTDEYVIKKIEEIKDVQSKNS